MAQQQDVSRLSNRTRTAMVDGKEVDADKAAQIHEVKEVFAKLQKAMKQIALYRHNTERYREYLEDTFSALADFLQRHGQLSLRVNPTSYAFHGTEVMTDDSKDNNLCYPFFANGIRMLMFNDGLTPDELLRFLMLLMSSDGGGMRNNEDFVTKLWKAELSAIQYVVVEGFKAVDDENADDVQMEVDKVVAYLYRQLQGNSDDVMRFARVDSADLDLKLQDVDQVRGAIISGITATPQDKERIQRALADEETNRLLPKMVVILFQLMELCTDEKNFEDVAEAYFQLLDAMLLAERYDVIQQILERFKVTLTKNLRPEVKPLVQHAYERFILKMGEPQRINQIVQVFNAGPVKDPAGVKAYMMQLSADSLPPLLDALERIEVANNRRLMCDVLVDLARDYPDQVANRLQHPSSQVVKDMMYILDQINPPNKLKYIATLLEHTNVVLRLETINTLGRNPSEETLPLIIKCLKGNDSQMRAAAARVMHFYEPERAAQELLHQANHPDFGKRDRNEQRAIFGGIAQVAHSKCQAFIQGILQQKPNMLNKRKVEDAKLLVIEGLAGSPSLPNFQALATVAQDATQSPEIQTAARNAALEMKTRLLGAQAAQRPAAG
ncbi:MAG: HEAT repeat domain-containing protein [Myxococcota bacterium]